MFWTQMIAIKQNNMTIQWGRDIQTGFSLYRMKLFQTHNFKNQSYMKM